MKTAVRNFLLWNRDLVIWTVLGICGVWVLIFLAWAGAASAQENIDTAITAAEVAAGIAAATEDSLPGWAVAIIKILVAVSGLLGSVLAFLKTKAGKGLTKSLENDAARKASVFASNTMFELALAALETMVKPAKKALADGKITGQEYNAILSTAKEGVLSKGKALTIDRLLGSGSAPTEAHAIEFLSDKIEAALPGVKSASVNPPSPSAGG